MSVKTSLLSLETKIRLSHNGVKIKFSVRTRNDSKHLLHLYPNGPKITTTCTKKSVRRYKHTCG